ncbi:MAG TPA: DUF2330 domain-containing protein [Acidimicrobiales bacterium]|nr:DUF2330 domain-containing protein [Acidimicrobiales bacterium]
MTHPNRRIAGTATAVAAALLGSITLLALFAGPASACAGLVTPSGNVKLVRTSTLAAWHAGVEHYVTSFTFSGQGEQFGAIVPLPAIPTTVERGGDWTLQRLARETNFQPASGAASAGGAVAGDSATVISQQKIDALEVTVLKGGGRAVGRWAKAHGFQLTPDTPEVLDFYAARSQIFMAARFDAAAAKERGQQAGEGTPVHITMPLANPWVPLRVLTTGRQGSDLISADVWLLTDKLPSLLPVPHDGVRLERVVQASPELLTDLRNDKGMGWMPKSMWLTHLDINEQAANLRYDLAVDATGAARPSAVLAGLEAPPPPVRPAPTTTPPPPTTVAPATTTEVPTTAAPPATIATARLTTSNRAPEGLTALAGALLGAIVATAVPGVRRRRRGRVVAAR